MTGYSNEKAGPTVRGLGSALTCCFAWLLMLGCASQRINTSSYRSDLESQSPKPLVELTFQQHDRLIFIPVGVNGSAPLRFVLSSSKSATRISKARAGQLGLLKHRRSFRARTETGWDQRWSLPEVEFNLAGLKYAPGNATAGTLPDSEPPADGVLGEDFFEHFVVELDYAEHRLRLYSPDAFQPGEGWNILPVEFRSGRPVVHAIIPRPNRSNVEGEFIVSIGLRAPLRLDSRFAATNRLPEVISHTLAFAKNDAGGYRAHLGQLPAFELGPFKMKDTEVLVTDPPPGTPVGLAGVIGGILLQQFNVVFDYPHSRLLLAPNHRYSKAAYQDFYMGGPFVIRAEDEFMILFSGATVIAPGPPFGEFRVVEVRKGSAAERAGLRAGDVIVKLDGQSPASLNLQQWMVTLAKPGRTCHLELLHNQEHREADLHTAWQDSYDF